MKAVRAKRSISTQLIRWVFGVYCVIAVTVTIFHMVKEYRHTQQKIVRELSLYQDVFGQVLARSIWDLDRVRITENLNVLFNMPVIVGIKIIKPKETEIFMAKGLVDDNGVIRNILSNGNEKSSDPVALLSYDFPLNYYFSGKIIKLADVTLYSDSNVVLSRVGLGYLFLLINSIIKSLALFIIFYFFAKYIILRPLHSLTKKIHSINFDNLDEYDSRYIISKTPNELDELYSSFNALVKELATSKNEIVSVKNNLENEVIERTSDLQKALDIKTRFLATISHEIRTPMNGIIGMLGLLKKNNQDEKNIRYINLAKESADTLLSLVNDVLDFSKIESGKMKLESRPFDIDYLIHAIYENYKYQAKSKEIDLVLDISKLESVWINGDSIRLKQIVGNLLSNAIKFTQEGNVTLNIALDQIEESLAQLIISVKDTGIGIKQENIPMLFNDFTQEDSSTTRRFGGTGLGLAIVRQLVELMNGSISVTSEIGKGSEFKITIPVEIAQTKSKIVQGHNENESIHKGRALLVEDNAINQEVAKELLSDFGLSVTICENGQEAIEALLADEFDVVFMDCQMPVMDGYAATKAIRNGEADSENLVNRDIPIIAMTANAIDGDKEKCLACGMNEYLSKPIASAELSRILLACLAIGSSSKLSH
ncbi:MAG: signal transduction histidine kinase/AmiR/NasT family two-component response regulator [Oceanicoccus sp.]|jgi:signal transduction histidine kinase/AmiR/NasT family two-component response regulator